MENIILIGMPGCGKSSIGKLLAQRMGRPFFDADEEIVKKIGCSIEAFFAAQGEAAFRRVETQVLSELGKRSGCVIATGGGCVTRPENEALLQQNGVILFLKRELSLLPTEGRPISKSTDLQALYERRRPLYEAFAHCTVDNVGSPEETVERILALLE